MRKQLYLAIIERLNKMTDEEGTSIIKHYDLWNEQLSFLEQEEPFELPALFVEFMPIDWRSTTDGTQTAVVKIRLHVLTQAQGSAAEGSCQQTDALALFDLLDNLHASLLELKADGFRGVIRTGSHTNHNHEEVIESIETFQVNVTDESGKRRQQLPSWVLSE